MNPARFKKVGGAHIGARARKVRVCEACGCQAHPGIKPDECLDCGGLAFITFDSVAECARWNTLRILESRGEISNLRRQVSFDLMAATTIDGRVQPSKVVRYIADFVYERGGERVIEDVKSRGVMTDVAALKLKWMQAMGLPVKIVQA